MLGVGYIVFDPLTNINNMVFLQAWLISICKCNLRLIEAHRERNSATSRVVKPHAAAFTISEGALGRQYQFLPQLPLFRSVLMSRDELC